jgi:hypothetical protein
MMLLRHLNLQRIGTLQISQRANFFHFAGSQNRRRTKRQQIDISSSHSSGVREGSVVMSRISHHFSLSKKVILFFDHPRSPIVAVS